MEWPELMIWMRHGEHGGNDNPECLTPFGIEQARTSGIRVREIYGGFDVFISSSMVRARETMEIAFPGVDYIQDSRIVESSFTIIGTADIDISYRNKSKLDKSILDFANYCNPVLSFVYDMKDKYAGKKVFAIMHGGTLNVLDECMRELGVDVKRSGRDYCENCSAAVYRKGKDGKIYLEDNNVIFY